MIRRGNAAAIVNILQQELVVSGSGHCIKDAEDRQRRGAKKAALVRRTRPGAQRADGERLDGLDTLNLSAYSRPAIFNPCCPLPPPLLCTLLGAIESSSRKKRGGDKLGGEDGAPCGWMHAVWMQPEGKQVTSCSHAAEPRYAGRQTQPAIFL